MAQNGSNKREHVALALAGGASVRKAAQEHQVGERTIYRWLNDDAFRHCIFELRTTMFDQTVGQLTQISYKAASVLDSLLDCDDARVQLSAAKTILETGMRAREALEVERRLEEIERKLNGHR